MKFTDVSEGGGPEVSRTMARVSGITLGADGDAAGVGVAGACLEPHAVNTINQVAGAFRARDIPRILKSER
jgi:hypothetical protein